MSGSPLIIPDTVALSVSIAICAFASYRAFSSRRFLPTPLYRNRALWTGTVALILIVVDAFGIFLENTNSSVSLGITPPAGTTEFYVFVAMTAAASAVIFGWIDSTIGVALELDFLHRDALRWKTLRPAAGVAIVFGTVVAQFATTTLTLLVAIVLLLPSAAYLASVLVVGGARVKVETMRRYMRWMGLLVASLLLLVVTSTFSAYFNFPLAIAAYFLYGMSTSLLKTAPLRVATAGIVPAEGPAMQPRQGPAPASG